MLGWIQSIAQGIGSLASDIVSGITEGFQGIIDGLGNMLLDGIKAIFVPSEDFITEKVDYLKLKFGFVTSVVNSVKQIADSIYNFNETTPPVIEVNLASSTSKYDYGNTALVLDLSWFAPYKDTVDTVLGSIMWVFFLWRLFVHLPGIINGVSGSIDPAVDIYNHESKSGRG